VELKKTDRKNTGDWKRQRLEREAARMRAKSQWTKIVSLLVWPNPRRRRVVER